jgi:cytochrome b subunit of formate dehydrogenase
MTDIIHAKDAADFPEKEAAKSAVKSRAATSPRSDWGTIFLHWLTAIAMVVSIFTGLRISADAPTAVISKFLAPILPQGEIWTWHILAGLTLFFCLTAYVVYMALSGLFQRNALRKTQAIAIKGKAAKKARWGAVNVALHWFMYGVVLLMTVTGILLYLGYGNLVVDIHAAAAIVSFAYIFVHVTTHYLYGGLMQLLRLFKPDDLTADQARGRKPLLIASVVGLPVIIGLGVLDYGTRDQLVVPKVSQAPDPQKLLADPVWKNVRPVVVHTMQGANMGGTGESTIEVRAVRDDQKIYFAFRWTDPSRSLKRVPLIKKEDGWHVSDRDVSAADVTEYYEDKFAILFSHTDAFGDGGVAHMGPKPLADRPAPLNKRGLHYTTDGTYADMWQWKASRGGMLGYVENMHIGPPELPTPAEAGVNARYQAGYTGDPGKSMYLYNYPFEKPGGYAGPVTPLELPKDYKATVAAMGKIDLAPDASVDKGSKWWMFRGEDTVPYSKEADDKIPVGTVMPGVLIVGKYEGLKAGITGHSEWEDGHWTLVASRDLHSNSKYDVDFAPEAKLYTWVAAYDHTQTRHTRHMRPIELIIK